MTAARRPTGIRLDELPDGYATQVSLDGVKVLLIRLAEDVRAVSGWCTHARSLMVEQKVSEDGLIECPSHGAVFDSADGSLQLGPTCDPLPVYPVVVCDDGTINVDLPADASPAPIEARVPGFGSWGAATSAPQGS